MPPIFEYTCKDCGLTIETPNRDMIVTSHFGCDGELKRVYSIGGIVLKGKGFHRTDK
jgi:predicted nucleic acid-binding Zn ribbon protein